MIDRLIRYLQSVDLATCGFSARGIALGLPVTGGFAWPHVGGLYALYRGVGTVDYVHPVGAAGPGSTSIVNFPTFPLAASTAYLFGVRAIGPGGVEESGVQTVAIATDGDGVPILPAPNAPTNLIVAPRAGGAFALSWQYRRNGEQASPATYAVYHDNGTGTMDYVTPLVVTGATAYLTAGYANATVVQFVVRSRTAAGIEDANVVIRSGTADGRVSTGIETPVLTLGEETI